MTFGAANGVDDRVVCVVLSDPVVLPRSEWIASPGKRTLPVLEAAPIRPFADRPEHEVRKGKAIAIPANPEARPDPGALEWHSKHVFRP